MKDGNKKTSILGYSAVRLCDHIVIDGSINTWTRQNCRCKTSDTRHSKPLSIYSERHITIAVIVVCNLVQKQQVHKHFYKVTKLFLTNTEKYTLPSMWFFICPIRNRWCIRRRRFWHATHDCVAPYVDIILHRGRFHHQGCHSFPPSNKHPLHEKCMLAEGIWSWFP